MSQWPFGQFNALKCSICALLQIRKYLNYNLGMRDVLFSKGPNLGKCASPIKWTYSHHTTHHPPTLDLNDTNSYMDGLSICIGSYHERASCCPVRYHHVWQYTFWMLCFKPSSPINWSLRSHFSLISFFNIRIYPISFENQSWLSIIYASPWLLTKCWWGFRIRPCLAFPSRSGSRTFLARTRFLS